MVPFRYLIVCSKRYLRPKCLVLVFLLVVILILVKWTHLWSDFVAVESSLGRESSKTKSTTLKTPVRLSPERLKQIVLHKRMNILTAEKNMTEMKLKWLREKVEKLRRMMPKPEATRIIVNETVPVNPNVHVFYYAWYESEVYDGSWQHWNHEYLKNWRKNDMKAYPTGFHVPPEDIGSNFYPKLGCYSSRDPAIVDKHMKLITDAGIGVIIVSWYPPGMSDRNSRSPDTIFLQLLNAALRFGLKVSPHVEPYENRNPLNLLQHLKYFASTYGSHPALYRMKRNDRDLIVYYIYDSYRTPAVAWKELLDPKGNISVRGTKEDGVFLGLLVDVYHKHEIKKARFDGFYTYFASNGFTYGSTWKNWKTLASLARSQNLIFVPSIGPGYVDTRVRPWNAANTRHRRRGKYYEVGWRTAINAGVGHVSITSFNEWHEGTQIEPAIAKTTDNFTYLDYEPEGPDFYMNLTKFWIREFVLKNSKVSNTG